MYNTVAMLLLVVTFVGGETNNEIHTSLPAVPMNTENVGAHYKTSSSSVTTEPIQLIENDIYSAIKKEAKVASKNYIGLLDYDDLEKEEAKYETVHSTGTTENGVDQNSSLNSVPLDDDNNSEVSSSPNKEQQNEINIKEEENSFESSEESKSMKKRISETDDTGKGEVIDISMKCLDCLCQFATNCDVTRDCVRPNYIYQPNDGFSKGECGPFHISFPFWADAHNIKMDLGDAVMENDWQTCSLDLMCATETMKKYFQKYPHDCNGDGKIDCVDYAAIHTLGPFGCLNGGNLRFWNKIRRKGLLKCMVSEEEGRYTKEMHRLNEKLKLQDFAAKKRAELQEKNSVDEMEEEKQAGEENALSEITTEESDDSINIVVDVIQI